MLIKLQTNNSLGKEAIQLTISKVLTLIISTITAMLLSRFRTLQEYGTYSQLLLVVNLFTTVFMLGLPNSINYFLARASTQEERQKFLSVYYSLSSVLSIILGLVLALATPFIVNYFNNPDINGFIYFLAIFPWTSVISSSIENVLVIFKKTDCIIYYRLLNSLCILIAVVFVQVFNWGFSGYVIFFLSVNVAFALLVYAIVNLLSGGLRLQFDVKLIKTIFAFSIPLGIATVVGTLDIEIDKLLIGYLMDTEQMAIYTNASKELPVSIVAASITAVLLPKMVRMEKENRDAEAVRLWGYATELSYIMICLIAFGTFVFADDVITILYSEKYLAGVAVFRVYCLVLLLRCTYFGMMLNAKGKTKEVLYCSIAALVLNAILNPIFYYWIGMVGPAVATFVSMFVAVLFQLCLTGRFVGLSLRHVFPWKKLGYYTIVCGILAILFYVLKLALPLEKYIGSIAESIALGLIWTVLYFLSLKKPILRTWRALNEEN